MDQLTLFPHASSGVSTHIVVQYHQTGKPYRFVCTFEYADALELVQLRKALGKRELLIVYEGSDFARATALRNQAWIDSEVLERLCKEAIGECVMNDLCEER